MRDKYTGKITESSTMKVKVVGMKGKLREDEMIKTTATGLKKMDVQIRNSVRGWLHQPHDVPIAYLHAPVRSGGLGVPCL